MLYKFKSKAAGDLIMLEDSGRAILTIIGKGDPQTLKQGIVQPPDMPAAIAALQQAVVEEDARMQLKVDAVRDAGRSLASGGPAISLRQRSLPFIRMLERCHAENKEIVWGV
jgi:cyclopropane-fatty-acyl-phospholipid synthase